MARALSEGEFDRKFQQHFQGELGELASYLDAVRQTLKYMSSAEDNSRSLIPAAVNGFQEIRTEAETGFNSVMGVVEEILDDQTQVRRLLKLAATTGNGLAAGDVGKLQEIAEKDHQSLMRLMSYLSFQDVLRQRVEKVQKLIETLKEKTLDLMVKFKIKANEKLIKENDGAADLTREMNLNQRLVDELMQRLR